MITVRFPSGVAVQYNNANDWTFYSDRVELLRTDEQGHRWVQAVIPLSTGCIIEWTKACVVTAAPLPSPDAAIDRLLELHESGKLSGCASWKLKDLKRAMQQFNARSQCWR